MGRVNGGRGRRLSLVQELNQTIDLESSFNGDINMNIPNNDGVETNFRERVWRRPERISTTVIDEEDEVEAHDEKLPLDPGTEEANVGFYQNQIPQNQQSVDVVELRNQLNDDIGELNSKITRVENQLALLIRLMQNQKRPELHARHSHPTPTTSSSSSSSRNSQKDHNASVVNSVAAQDSENTSSPVWLSPTPVRSDRSQSDPNHKKTTSKRERNDETVSPVVNLARHGRRTISDA